MPVASVMAAARLWMSRMGKSTACRLQPACTQLARSWNAMLLEGRKQTRNRMKEIKQDSTDTVSSCAAAVLVFDTLMCNSPSLTCV